MSPIQATAAILENMVLRPSLFKLMATKSNPEEEEHLDEIRITSRKSVGNNPAKLSLHGGLVVALRREGKLVPPNGATILKHNDILTLLGDNKSLERAKRILQIAD